MKVHGPISERGRWAIGGELLSRDEVRDVLVQVMLVDPALVQEAMLTALGGHSARPAATERPAPKRTVLGRLWDRQGRPQRYRGDHDPFRVR